MLVTMEILLNAKCFRRLAISGFMRAFHRDYRTAIPQNFSNYESMKQDFKLEIPEYFNFAKDVLDQWTNKEKAGQRPSNPAFWWIDENGDEVKWSFEELGSLSRRFANILTEACSLKKGDRVIVILPKIPEWWLANVACLRTGTIIIPGTTQLTQKDIFYRLQSSKAKCVITDDTLAPAVDAVAPKCEYLHSKLIVSQNSREGWGNLKEMIKHASDSHACVKTKHDETMAIYFTSGTTGPPKMIGHTHTSFGLGLSVNGSYKFKSLKHCVSAGEPINPEVIEQWRNRTGLDIYEGYGQTETILDESGNILPPEQEGDIGIQVLPNRPFGLFSHYIDDPSKTASTLRGNFYVTGDRGYMDKDGYFWFVARSDDVILSSGYRIGPFEVESALMEHPSVVESAVVSSPDPIRGEVVKAFIVLNPDYKSHDQEQLKKEIQEHVKKTTAPYKYPRKVEFIQELPKTISGKIKRNELRKKEWKTI
ncbi:Acyl-coenzyme A synthetase ACSM3, mitochondrial [Sciurus carolinensis]|uniref:medium-chain acyl-CoA ligase n=1 Tax=Sciurus carolinensis TaxID=30640 RepID=A0AA41MNK9_SCICA|nr:Acyl-coenzyme A synthetase ACSM3, mitochondrial [Sciurus carolinensis]